MMAETLVDNAVCGACGADVREESLFCYNCGASVQGAVPEPAPIEPKPAQPVVDSSAPAESANPDARPPLRSAASLRKQRRASNRQPVEVSWQQPTGAPVGFIIATIVLSAGALVLLILALYLR